MEIRRVVATECSGSKLPPVDDGAKLKGKAEALVRAARKRDVIEVRRFEGAIDDWYKATKLDSGKWLVVDGTKGFEVTAEELLGERWVVNSLSKGKEEDINKERQSKLRQIKEKEEMLIRIAKMGAEEERQKELYQRFHYFNSLPINERTFEKFHGDIVQYVRHPSDHTISVDIDGTDNVMDVVAHESGSAAMRQLVTRRVLQSLIQVSIDRQKNGTKTKTKTNRLGKVRKGSDGFRKCLQLDEQHLLDIDAEESDVIIRKAKDKKKLKRRLKAFSQFKKSTSKKNIWDDGNVLDTKKLNGTQAMNIICIFEIPKCSGMSKEGRIAKLKSMGYTKQTFAAKEEELKCLAMGEVGIGDTDEFANTDIDGILEAGVVNNSGNSEGGDSDAENEASVDEDGVPDEEDEEDGVDEEDEENEDSEDFEGETDDDEEGDSDEDFELMTRVELQKAHQQRGLTYDKRWGHKSLLENINKKKNI